jgi:hypothetical protein
LAKAGSIRWPSEIARGFAGVTFSACTVVECAGRKCSILLFDRVTHML